MHGFTLRLPEDHRVHGSEIVGLSFFAIAPDHNNGGPDPGLEIAELLSAYPESPPEDAGLAAIWKHARDEHSRLYRMQDEIECEYAVILLTEEEFAGKRCEVPDWVDSASLNDVRRPDWLYRGEKEIDAAYPFWQRELGGDPNNEKGFERAIQFVKRAHDPNAGVVAEEDPDEDSPYTYPRDPETFELLDWAKDHAANHLGGTMQPIQQVPDFSPHYIEFEEYFGGYNFGTGKAQLDFLNMKFDFAC